MYFLRYGAAWACLRLNDDLWGMTGSSLRKQPPQLCRNCVIFVTIEIVIDKG